MNNTGLEKFSLTAAVAKILNIVSSSILSLHIKIMVICEENRMLNLKLNLKFVLISFLFCIQSCL